MHYANINRVKPHHINEFELLHLAVDRKGNALAHKRGVNLKLLVAMPCLNEAANIAEVIGRVPTSIEGVSDITILVIDDGSTDNTSEIAIENGAIVIKHRGNRGVGSAFHTAVNFAIESSYDIMVNIDGDGQFNPADISKLISPIINSDADFVSASRFIDKAYTPKMPYVKLFGNHMMSHLVSSLCGQKFYDVSCGFRAYSRETLLQINLHGAFTYTQETFIDLASKRLCIVEIPVEVKYFKERTSRVAKSISKYAVNTFMIITRIYRDYYPFKFFGGISLFFLLIGIGFGLLFFYNFMLTRKFTGFLFAGFISAFCMNTSMIFGIAAISMDMLVRIRVNQERTLYSLKKTLKKGNHDV